MSYLLDTHALVWWLAVPERLSPRARDCIRSGSSQSFVSAVSLYEVEYKRGRDGLLYRLPSDLLDFVPSLGFEWLSMEAADSLAAARFGEAHRDPWDRIIAAQAETRGLGLITADAALTEACAEWGVQVVW
ncbi:type II toxin-antitoxin system VapC family toxin [Caulobacter endophyticus]|uniref:type II toxin-antitoxin system VapC family toxin n=1 Tax=Caulobacter endophyticus TaxID=2172652 RepID=UPI00240EC34F|nr:type II toxin-antitoxin system VapC family toxin [Caulobacter endophyticus]MDG2527747.1 type II toxin-antitoxin system VapC family toxin [Caulobacter endophyticus]